MAERLLTKRQQAFVVAICQGMNQIEAYKAAGYPVPKLKSSLTSAASKEAGKAPVEAALARARAAVARRLELTATDLVEQLLEAREIALGAEVPQANAAVAATMGIGKLLGLVIDRKDINVTRDKPALLPVKAIELTEDEWKRSFVPGRNGR